MLRSETCSTDIYLNKSQPLRFDNRTKPYHDFGFIMINRAALMHRASLRKHHNSHHLNPSMTVTSYKRPIRRLTGSGCFRRLNTLVSPRLREAMVGWGPNEGSLSLCQPILSLPSRYRLHSNELNVRPLFCSTARRRELRTGGHYNKREI